MADKITGTVVMKRSATPRELQKMANNFRLEVMKLPESGNFKANVVGQEHITAEAPTEYEAIREVKHMVEKQFLEGSLKVNQKMI